MPLCVYSNDYKDKGFTPIDNAFIVEYLPVMDATAVRVYLYGLYLCSNPLGEDNNIKSISDGLSLDEKAIRESFDYLKKIGLVTIRTVEPLCISFNSPKDAINPNRTYNKDKYSDFLIELNELFQGRELSQNEIVSYLDYLEETKIEQGALSLIIGYCIKNKGVNVKPQYVLTVARDWFESGYTTLEETNQRLLQSEASSEAIRDILHALKSKRACTLDDRQLYIKWTSEWGFEQEGIIAAAKLVKKGGMEKLDKNLQEYASNGVYSALDIKAWAQRKEELYDCTYKVLKRLGLYYSDCSALVEDYFSKWFEKGFGKEGLLKIARYCQMEGKNRFVEYAGVVEGFFKEGYVADYSVDLQLNALTRLADCVQKVLAACGISRKASDKDIDLYRVWVQDWSFSEQEILSEAANFKGTPFPINALSRRLSEIKDSRKPIHYTNVPREEKKGLGDFEKAEIKFELKKDSEYLSIEQRIKKLDFEMSEYTFKNKPVPLVMKEEREALALKLNERIRQLGFNPDDLA